MTIVMKYATPRGSRPKTTLFSPSKHRASNTKRNVLAVARAMTAVMQRELGQDALLRWQDLIDTELGEALFGKIAIPKRVRMNPSTTVLTDGGSPNPAPRAISLSSWIPKRPKLAILLLDAFQCGDQLMLDGKPLLQTGTTADGRTLSKILSKRAIDWIKQHQPDAFVLCGEMAPDQISNSGRLQKVVGRTAADVLSYVHSIASASRGIDDADVTIELHRTDQRLASIDTRGCGVVFCAGGRVLFETVVSKMLSCLTESNGL